MHHSLRKRQEPSFAELFFGSSRLSLGFFCGGPDAAAADEFDSFSSCLLLDAGAGADAPPMVSAMDGVPDWAPFAEEDDDNANSVRAGAEVEAEEEEVEKSEVVAMVPTAAAIVSAATSPSPSTPSTTAAPTGGVKRQLSAVVSYDELLAVVDATLPSTSTSSSSDTSDSEEDEQDHPMPSSSSSSSSSSGMKRVRSYSSDLSSFAAPGDEVAKRTRLLEPHP